MKQKQKKTANFFIWSLSGGPLSHPPYLLFHCDKEIRAPNEGPGPGGPVETISFVAASWYCVANASEK